MQVRHHFIRDLVSEGEIQVEFISTNDQPADVLTKVATIDKIEWFKKQKDYKLRGVLEINLQF